MRKVSQDEVAAAARRRLELLGRELEQAGLTRRDDAPPLPRPDPEQQQEPEPGDHLREPAALRPAGRHAASRRPGRAGGIREGLAGLVLCGLFATGGVWIGKAAQTASGGSATITGTNTPVTFGN